MPTQNSRICKSRRADRVPDFSRREEEEEEEEGELVSRPLHGQFSGSIGRPGEGLKPHNARRGSSICPLNPKALPRGRNSATESAFRPNFPNGAWFYKPSLIAANLGNCLAALWDVRGAGSQRFGDKVSRLVGAT
ncbi:hypothetical protein KM043_014895 [Ampulex compressa]|nr:hypothetical protein KM043_014895 [Ampulex compressa]